MDALELPRDSGPDCRLKSLMAKTRKNHTREERIENEIVVDAYGPEERAMGCTTIWKTKYTFPSRPNALLPKWFPHLEKEKLSKFCAWHQKKPAPTICWS